ncbi:MAG TPA: RNA ligase family protein [Chitinophagaceae bacterium]|nr:RNA ligase family protein [Chitinophagaceae bacterium]
MFQAWPKIPRVENRKEFYTEKIDGTNACIIIKPWLSDDSQPIPIEEINTEDECYGIWAQSRTRLITPEDDNFGFAKWVKENAEELIKLGEGYHYGEWWGKGIGRGYGLDNRLFSLFNTARWHNDNPPPSCCSVVPTIHANSVEEAKQILIDTGSLAAPGFMNVEGVVVFEYNTKSYWKAIINK